jgi:hypothetical protein
LSEVVTLSASTWVCTRDFNLNNAPSNSSDWWGATGGPAAGVSTIVTVAAPMPPPPVANAGSVSTIALTLPSALEVGALYWVSVAIQFRTYNSDNSLQSIQFVDSVDTLALSLLCDTVDIATSNNRVTIASIRDRPGQLLGGDQYPQFLTCQLQNVQLTSGISLEITLQNKSGTCTWGTASTIEATIYKV